MRPLSLGRGEKRDESPQHPSAFIFSSPIKFLFFICYNSINRGLESILRDNSPKPIGSYACVDRNKDPTQVPERMHAHLRTNRVVNKVTGQGTVKFGRNPKSTLRSVVSWLCRAPSREASNAYRSLDGVLSSFPAL